MLNVNRRTLLKGGLSLAASTLPLPALAITKRRAHVVTALDWSVSTGKYFVTASMDTEVQTSSYIQNLMAFASTVRNHLGRDLEESGFDEVDFEAFRWGLHISLLVERRTLVIGKCQPELDAIAEEILSYAGEFPNESTFMGQALAHALTLFNAKTDRDVLNVVTDDDASREGLETLAFYKPEAEARGLITNGFIWGDPEAMNAYFDTLVRTGGPESFVLRAQTEEAIRANWRKKFVLDLY